MNAIDDQDQWTDDKQKQLMDFLTPPEMKQGMALQSGAPSTPPAGGIPPPPTDLAASGESASQGSTEPGDKVADSHPGLKASDIPPDAYSQYLKGEQGAIDKFGPEKQAQVMQKLQQGYRSPGNVLAKGGATLADAIMQGVARAGNPGNLSAINERENQNLNLTADMGKSLQEQKLQSQGAKQRLEAMNASTPLGATEAQAARFLAQKLWPNATPEQLDAIQKNPQALKGILPMGIDLQKALAEIANTQAFREAQIGIQKETLQNTKAHQKTEEDLASENQRLQHPILSRLGALGSGTDASAHDGRVTVISPKGQLGHIPASQLKDALAKGYKQK